MDRTVIDDRYHETPVISVTRRLAAAATTCWQSLRASSTP
jgi:hypothetical protein